MTRINTNVGSLVGRNNLQRANAGLSQALTRLSTGLRINTGKDDPAGLIASENLRSDITSIRKAISNTDRANQVIATADSALGQVSSLLNDIRGLVTESANAGALSDEQISANQLQVDSSLEALNRIAQTTTFQGRRLLDGSLDFITSATANFSELSSLQIDQANLGASGQVSVEVNVTTAATQATVEVGSLPDVTPTVTTSLEFDVETTSAAASTGSVDFDITTTDTQQATGSFVFNSTGTIANFGGSGDTLTAEGFGTQANFEVVIVAGTGSGPATASFGAGAGTGGIDLVTVDLNGSATEGSDFVAGLVQTQLRTNVDDSITITSDGTSAVTATAAAALTFADDETLSLTAVEDGIADGTAGNAASLTLVQDATTANGVDSVSFAGGVLTINGDFEGGGVTTEEIQNAINAYTSGGVGVFTASGASTGGSAVTLNTLTTAGVTDANANSEYSVITGTGAGGTDGAAAVTTTETIDITGTLAAGADGNFNLSFAEAALGGASASTAVFGNATTGYTVQINTDFAGGVDIDDIRAAIQTISEVDTAVISTAGTSTYQSIEVGGTGVYLETPPTAITLTSGEDQAFTTQTIDITTAVGVVGNFNLSFSEQNLSGGLTNVTGTFAGGYNVAIDNSTTVTIDNIRSAIESISEVGSATLGTGTSASTTYDASVDTEPTTLAVVGAGASTATSGIDADLVFELAGATGSEVLSFESGTSLALLIDGVNAVSDATGVTAAENGTSDGVVFTSTEYGSSEFVDISIIEEGTGGAFTTALDSGTRVSGTDITASVNGITATGDGNKLSINTATLDLSTTVSTGFVGAIQFDITGGGALFQLGPEVVSNQQARLGISSVNTAALGGVSGLLYQLGTGGTADLSADATTAAEIVGEAIDQVTSLRGRLGAFQRTTLETNKNALNDTLANLTEAESTIRDADFAAETANLTRSQILVQSGTRVLAIANQNPQNVLGLLG